MADPYDVNKRMYPEESKSETFSPRRPFGKKKGPKYKQLKLDLPLAYGGKAKFKNDPTTGPNA